MEFWSKIAISAVMFAVSAFLLSFVFSSMVVESCSSFPTMSSDVMAGGRQIKCINPPLVWSLALFILTFVPVIATVYLFTKK